MPLVHHRLQPSHQLWTALISSQELLSPQEAIIAGPPWSSIKKLLLVRRTHGKQKIGSLFLRVTFANLLLTILSKQVNLTEKKKGIKPLTLPNILHILFMMLQYIWRHS